MSKSKSLLIPSKKTVLAAIDYQEKLLPAINNKEEVLKAGINAVSIAKEMGLPIILTEQVPEKIGTTAPGIASAAGDGVKKISKASFSCCGEEGFLEALEKTNAKNVIICGIEAHVCVLQTALDLLSLGYNVYILADALGSRKEMSKDYAIKRMKTNGAEIITVEMMAFELLRDANHACFKNISKIVK